MTKKMPNSLKTKNASPAAAATNEHAAGIYHNVLKVSSTLSFIFGAFALSLYAAEYYYAHYAEDTGDGVPPSFKRFTHFAYVLGVGEWILTGLFAYLGPFVLEKYWGAGDTPAPVQASYLAGALLLSKRAALWGLVVGPSVGVFVYATWVEVPHARFTLYGDETDYSPTSAFDWASVLVLAMALPAGTAGMVSMGIYVFGAVARHSPLWSAYLVLPSEKTDANCCSPGHSNLMMDALRLHQISGYITFWFFFLHSAFYALLYGFEGLYESAADEDEYLSGNYTFKLDNLAANETSTEDSSEAGPGFITLFLQSVWRAIVPPPECFPLTGPGRDYTWNPFWEEESSHDSHDKIEGEDQAQRHNRFLHSEDEAEGFMGQAWDYDPCYGLYRNFQGLLAFLAVLVLVLTSLNCVRRRSYRFFYVSHILTATMMVVTMCLHYPRIVLYLLPSLVCYLATTIPTAIQGWFSAYLDGGVEIDEWTVLETASSKPKKKKLFGCGKGGDDGVLELTFVVDPKSGEALEATATEPKVSYRPKSVRICVPSISLLWYPFTVIEQTPVETAEGQKAFRCTVLLGTVGYFTKSLWKKFHQLQLSTGGTETGSKGSGGDTGGEVSSSDGEGGETKTTEKQIIINTSDQRQPGQPPLVLVDGFYSGATDWIKDAMSHDSLLIGAGGTGVTPFLAFLPHLLSLVLDDQASDEGQESLVPNVSFLWCCRDEALIRHVVKTYLLPLVRRVRERNPKQEPQSQRAKMRLMIYNTSRKSDDDNLLDLSLSQSPTGTARGTASRRGTSMQPSRVQYHPRLSNPSQVAGTVTTFLSIAIVGVAVLVWQWHHSVANNRRLYGVRLHGLYVLVAWSFVVGIGAEVYKRYFGSSGAAKDGSDLGKEGNGSSTSSDKEDAEELESAEDSDTPRPSGDESLGVTKDLELSSLAPGKLHCYPEAADSPVLELILSNGRPILGSTGENACSCFKRNKPDDGVETGETATVPTSSEVALSELASADRPGVFYCGADKLLEAIQKCVKVGQTERRRELKKSSATSSKITNCVYYKESFEM